MHPLWETGLSGAPLEEEFSKYTVNAFGMVTASSFLMIPTAFFYDGLPKLSLSVTVWAALLSIAILSTAVAYMLYFATLVRAGAANLMLVTLLIPPFAIALGALFLGEQIQPQAWLGFAIIGGGFAITDGRVLRRRSKN